MRLIEQVRQRPSFLDGWETDKATFAFRCPHCEEAMSVTFKEMLDAAWGWKDGTAPLLRERLGATFAINLNNRSIGSGMAAVVSKACAKCRTDYHFYFWLDEYRNSCYAIGLRAIAEGDTEPTGGGSGLPPPHR